MFSCSGERHSHLLIWADSLQAKEYNDSALDLLDKIDLTALSQADSAYYLMLNCFIRFKLFQSIKNDSSINQSIRYYESVGDKLNLARAYVYKASILDDDKLAETVLLLKKSEYLIKEVGIDENIDLLLRTYSNLAYVNSSAKAFISAKDYACRVLSLAEATGSRRWIGYACLELSHIYYRMGHGDSAAIYIKKIEPFIDAISEGEQAVYFHNMALNYEKLGKADSAVWCLKESLKKRPDAHTYATLAHVYTLNNRMDEARMMWEKAFQISNRELRVSFMQPYAEWLYKIGEKDSAWKVSTKIPLLKDSLMHVYQAETVLAEQNWYDRQKANMLYLQRQRKLLAVLVIITILLLLVAVVAYTFSLRHKKIVADGLRRRAELKTTISDYERLVKRLRYEGKSHTKEMKTMQRKLDTLRTEQNKILYLGKTNYDWIESGGTTGKWRINDFRAYLEYYRTMDLPFLLHLEVEYDSLSPTQMFHLVLEHMGKSKDEIMRIMNFNANSFRVARSRILHKRVVEHF